MNILAAYCAKRSELSSFVTPNFAVNIALTLVLEIIKYTRVSLSMTVNGTTSLLQGMIMRRGL